MNRMWYGKEISLIYSPPSCVSSLLLTAILYSQEKWIPSPSAKIFYEVPTLAIVAVFDYLCNKYLETKKVSKHEYENAPNLEEIITLRELRRIERSGVWTEAVSKLDFCDCPSLSNYSKNKQADEKFDPSVFYTEEEINCVRQLLTSFINENKMASVLTPEELYESEARLIKDQFIR